MRVPQADPGELVSGLIEERSRLVELLGSLPERCWRARTGADGWLVADHVAQLALLDEAAALAVTAPRRFATHARARAAGRTGPADVAAQRSRTGPELLARLAGTQDALLRAYRELDPEHRLPWYGTDLGVGAALAARLTDTWAHGWDVAEALGVPWPATDRLRHVAELGVHSLGACFEELGRPVPSVPVRVELTGPGGQAWVWGREHARDRVSGGAEDLCLVLSGRRPVGATGLRVGGVVVGEWLAIARPYPGAPSTPARRPLDAPVR